LKAGSSTSARGNLGRPAVMTMTKMVVLVTMMMMLIMIAAIMTMQTTMSRTTTAAIITATATVMVPPQSNQLLGSALQAPRPARAAVSVRLKAKSCACFNNAPANCSPLKPLMTSSSFSWQFAKLIVSLSVYCGMHSAPVFSPLLPHLIKEHQHRESNSDVRISCP
jgi:hypothetical protein